MLQVHAINDLPNDCLLTVFRHLKATDLSIIRRVCKKWKELASNDLLWKAFYPSYLPKTHQSYFELGSKYLEKKIKENKEIQEEIEAFKEEKRFEIARLSLFPLLIFISGKFVKFHVASKITTLSFNYLNQELVENFLDQATCSVTGIALSILLFLACHPAFKTRDDYKKIAAGSLFTSTVIYSLSHGSLSYIELSAMLLPTIIVLGILFARP